MIYWLLIIVIICITGLTAILYFRFQHAINELKTTVKKTEKEKEKLTLDNEKHLKKKKHIG